MTQETEEFGHLVGTVLCERYLIKALLGAGGMGAVFEGEHLLMHKRVAIKILRPEVSQAGEVVARFEREAMATARIDHPNVVTATDFGKTPEGGLFLVLEYVEGRNLRVLLAHGALAPARAMRIVEQVASVLVKAHALGIVHRDLKPENIMLVRKDEDPDFVKVLDFGIAKVPVDELRGQQVQTGQGLTQLGVMYGTPEYMAPEQAMGTGVDHRADLYSLGVMLFEMVTGERPFDSENVISLVTMHIVEPPPKLSSRMPPGAALPPGLEELVAQLLEKDREQRPQTARELVDRLRALAGGADRSPPPPSVERLPAGSASPHPTGLLDIDAVASARTAFPTSSPWASPEAGPAAGQAGASGPGSTPTAVIPAADEPRWRRELRAAMPELERARAALPGPLARLPLVAFPAAFGGVLLLIVLAIAWPRGPAATAAPAASASAASAALTEADIDEAARSGAASLEALAERFPDDPRVARALLKFHHDGKRPAEAIKALARLSKLQKDVLSDDLALSALKAAVDGPAEASDAAFTLLESGLGEPGIEALYAMWTSKKEVSSKAQARAGKSLTRPEVRERAPRPIRALVDLKVTPASCETRRSGAELAREAGDARAVPLLQQLTSKRGCGFAGLQDCWGCLRRDNLLNEAIKAAEKRPEP